MFVIGEKAGMVSFRKIHMRDLVHFTYGNNRFVTPNECQITMEEDEEAQMYEEKPVVQNVEKVKFIDLTLNPPCTTQECNNATKEKAGSTTHDNSNSNNRLIIYLNIFITI